MSVNWWQNLGDYESLAAAANAKEPEAGTYERAFLDLARGISSATGYAVPVNREALPALRSLVKNQFPDLQRNPHLRAQIESLASKYIGSTLNGPISRAKSMEEYANTVSNIAKNYPNTKRFLNLIRKLAERTSKEGAPGYGQVEEQPVMEGGKAPGKLTLASRFIQPGTSRLDTTIPKKVESMVAGDFFNYYAPNPEHGALNGVYLNDQQWEKEVHYREPLEEPRSGDDQLYFPGFKLLPQYDNQQPVALELEDRFEDNMYAYFMSKQPNVDFLRDRQTKYDPIEDEWGTSYMQPEVTLEADGLEPYPDPEQPQSSAFMNRVGFRPIYDSYRDPTQPSRFNPPTLIMPAEEAFRLVQLNGFQAFSMT